MKTKEQKKSDKARYDSRKGSKLYSSRVLDSELELIIKELRKYKANQKDVSPGTLLRETTRLIRNDNKEG